MRIVCYSNEIAYLIFSKIKMLKNLSSAAVVIAALRVKRELVHHYDVVYSNDATNTTQLRRQTPNA